MQTLNYEIDTRTLTDIYEKMEQLAASYTPDWRFNREQPDAGSVIALLNAAQMKDNILYYNQMMDRFHTEFVNMLGVSLRPAQPACAMVIMDLMQDTVSGVDVPKGAKLLGDSGGQGSIIFETAYQVHITNTKLHTVFMASGKNGSIIPLKGRIRHITELSTEQEKQEMDKIMEDQEAGAFTLFDFTQKGVEKNALLLYHSSLFDGKGQDIYLQIEGGREVLEGLEKETYRLCYYGMQGMRPVEKWQIQDEKICLRLEAECKKLTVENKDYALLAIEAVKPPLYGVEVEGITLSCVGGEQPPAFIHNGITELSQERFAPFGDSITLYAECFIGHPSYFSKPRAKVRITLGVEYEAHEAGLTQKQEEEELKVIKRKLRTIVQDSPADIRIQELAIEYYNGRGWKKLLPKEERPNLGKEGTSGRYTIEFRCPQDWQPVNVGGYEGRCIRIQVVKADNCYLRPSIHHYPVIHDMKISYTYEGAAEQPEKLTAAAQTRKSDLTQRLHQGKNLPIFSRGSYAENVLFLGFQEPFESGPISLLFELEKNEIFQGMKLGYEYSALHGFKRLKVLDHTENMTKTGTILFQPPEDMRALEIEGNRCFWIKITDLEGKEQTNKPRILKIRLNAVEAYNIETLGEEEFYLDEVASNMQFALRANHILSADIWVNEQDELTQEQKEQMLRREPDNVKAEYNFLGEIERFFVKWEEVHSFELSQAEDRHYILDRMQNRICFGDGVHVKIPRNTVGCAFTAMIRCCSGQAGNVPAGAIHDAVSNLMFVNKITNPAAAFGGNNMESLQEALKRGATILSGRNRLVSEQDYIREIMAFSDSIAQVKCVAGKLITGASAKKAISLVILMQDYRLGSFSFDKIKADLQNHLWERCELTIGRQDLQIVEPLFIEISTEVWLESLQGEESIQLRRLFLKGMEEYLNPVSEDGQEGWQIGVLPSRTQLLMKINGLKKNALIKRVVITAKYHDRYGAHEVDYERIRPTAFHVCKSGTHKVHRINTI